MDTRRTTNQVAQRATLKRSALSTESEESSLLSCGSNTVSLIDSDYSDEDNLGLHTQRPRKAKLTRLVEAIPGWTSLTPTNPVCLLTTSSCLGTRSGGEQHVLIDAGPAPPDYAQATAQRSSSQSLVTDEESLIDAQDGDSISLREPGKKGIRPILRRHWKKLCLLNLAIYCILVTILLVVSSGLRGRARSHLLVNFPAEHPFNNFERPERFHESTSQCQFNSYSDFEFFIWHEPKNFHFVEDLDLSDYLGLHKLEDLIISGNVDIRPAPYGQFSAVQVVTSFASASALHAALPQLRQNTDGFHILHSPNQDILRSQAEFGSLSHPPARSNSGKKACLDIWVGIYIQTQFSNFTLRTENLNVDIGHFHSYDRSQAWGFRISDDSQIHTTKGNITASFWDGRNTNVTSDSGSIKGSFDLNNNLNLETKSGDIEVNIWHEGADFMDYLDSHPQGTPANLSTTTSTGRQALRILQNGYWYRKGGLRRNYPFLLYSSHSSSSGSISIEPETLWGGKIHAQSHNGSIDISGDQLRYVSGPVDEITDDDEVRHVWAERPTFKSMMNIDTKEGDINVCAPEKFWHCDDYWKVRGVHMAKL